LFAGAVSVDIWRAWTYIRRWSAAAVITAEGSRPSCRAGQTYHACSWALLYHWFVFSVLASYIVNSAFYPFMIGKLHVPACLVGHLPVSHGRWHCNPVWQM